MLYTKLSQYNGDITIDNKKFNIYWRYFSDKKIIEIVASSKESNVIKKLFSSGGIYKTKLNNKDIVAKCNFNVYSIKDITERDFFLDDIRTIRERGKNINQINNDHDHIYILQDNIFINTNNYKYLNENKSFKDFVTYVCNSLYYILYTIKVTNKWFKDIDKYDCFIAFRSGYPNDPDNMSIEEFYKMDNNLISKFKDIGFVSTNDFHGFEGSHGFIFVNSASSWELINFYKFLYNSEREKINNLHK